MHQHACHAAPDHRRHPHDCHGMDFKASNPNAPLFCRYRNQDGEAVYSDTALFQRNTAACPNKLKPRYTAPGTKPMLPGFDHVLPASVAAGLNTLESNLTSSVDVVTNHISALNAVAPSPAH